MKKTITFLLFVWVLQNSFSQSELYVFSKIIQNNSPSGQCDGRFGDYTYSHNLSYTSGKYTNNSNEAIIIIDFYEGYNDDPGFGCNGPCGQYSQTCGDQINETLSYYDRIDLAYNGPDPIICGIDEQDCLPLNYQAVLLPKISSPVDKVCEKQKLFPQHTDGQDHNITGLTWQYWTGTRWQDIPNHKNRYPLNVSLLDVFGTNWRSRFSGNLQLRFIFKAPFTTEILTSIQTYTIQLNECSPELQDIVKVKTSCNYTNDGSFKLIVDRQLNNETLIITLYDASNNALVNQEVTRNLVAEGNGNYSYQWQQGLDGGASYYIKYQAKEGVITSIPSTDPSWASLESSTPFTIQKSNAFNFTIQKLNDKNCFEVNDGRIQINASGGETDRTFQYQFYRNGVEQNNWTNFSNNTILNNLPKATYRIQVRQVKGETKCYAR